MRAKQKLSRQRLSVRKLIEALATYLQLVGGAGSTRPILRVVEAPSGPRHRGPFGPAAVAQVSSNDRPQGGLAKDFNPRPDLSGMRLQSHA